MRDVKQQTRNLYDLCFEDDQEFTEAYFKYIYHPGRNVTLTHAGEVVSALQLIPVALRIENHTQEGVPCKYISGACTHPAYRAKGLMRKLLERTFHKMYKEKDCFATLIPANEKLFGYYATTNFVSCFDYSREIIKTQPYPTDRSEKKTDSAPPHSLRWSMDPTGNETRPEGLTYTLFEKQKNAFPVYYIEDRRQYQGYQFCFKNFWDLALRDMEIFGGEAWLVTNPDQFLVGLAVCYPKKEHVHIPALTADSMEIRRDMICHLSAHYALEELRIITEPEKKKEVFPLGMARIIHADYLLQLYAQAHPKLRTAFSLRDPVLPENNRTYLLKGDGKVYSDQSVAPQVSIEELTQAVLGYRLDRLPAPLRKFPQGLPYMHLMLN